jgi:glycosyltransferase involved in cell wall biosynthesis
VLVAVDATSWANRRGYGRFARNVTARLVERDGDERYVLVCDEATAARDDLPEGADVRAVALRRDPTEAASADSQRPLSDLVRLTRATASLRPDVVLFPSVYTWFPVVGAPTVVGVHDLITEQAPELTLPSRAARARWRWKQRAATGRATCVFTVSAASRALVAKRLGVTPERLAVVPEAPDSVFGPREASEVAERLAPLGLNGEPFFLYAGGISPHKGLETLVAAYAALPQDAPRLVLAGALDGEAYLSAAGAVRAQIAELGLGERVLLPGHVSDETLACLYAGALAFVSPSRFEGFGLPAVEAAASGTAVVLSDIPAHRESLGDAARFFPVGDDAALAGLLATLVVDAVAREGLASAARERVAGLSWSRSAEVLHGLLSEAAHA